MLICHRLAVLLHKLREIGCGPFRTEAGEFRCKCPAHDDSSPSLYLRTTEDRILVHCHAGCTTDEVCDRLDHNVADLFLDADEPWVDADGVASGHDAADGAHAGVA